MGAKKKPHDEDEEDDDPFDLGDEFYDMLNEQMKKMFQAFPGMIPPNIDMKSFRKIFNQMLSNMNFDPNQIKNMDPEAIRKFMADNRIGMKGPFLFGMNFGFGPDGKPSVNSFGNVQPKSEGESEIKMERDPLVDIYEEGNDLVVVAEVPGVKKEDVELKASSFELEIVANTPDLGMASRNYHKIVPLPAEINPDVAKARYNNGILEVRLEKLAQEPSKKKIHID